MNTLYDLLGARPDDDAERLKDAFRKAVKANHPDLHVGDPDAPVRLRQVVTAYSILRHAEQRATYDRLLAFQRKQLRSRSRRIISYMMRNVVADAIAVVGLAVTLAGAYTLFTHVSKTPVDAKTSAAIELVKVPAPEPTEIAAIQSAARTDSIERDEPHDKLALAGVSGTAPVSSAAASEEENTGARRTADGGAALSPAERDAEAAKTTNKTADALGTRTAMTDANTTADHLKKNYGIEPLDQNSVRPVGVQSSSQEKDNGAPKSPSSAVALPDEKHEVRIPAKPRAPAKRALRHAVFRQVALENRSTCSGQQSCVDNTPPLFGVGF